MSRERGDFLDRHSTAITGAVLAALLLPSAIAGVATGIHSGFAARIVLALAALSVSMIPGIPKLVRRRTLIAVLYLAGALFMIAQGPASSAESWFWAATILVALFFGAEAGFLACAAYALSLAAIGAGMSTGALSWKADIPVYFFSSLESAGLCAASCFIVSRLIETFRESERNIDRLGAELRRRRIELERETACRIDAEGRAEFLANFDEISGLPNEQRFMEILERYLAIARARGRKSAVMALGIDRFRRVRETRGTGPSDAILREAAERLRRSFREDDFVARLGWDGFIVLLSDVKEHEDLSGIIKKARMAFDRSFRVEDADIGLSASLGIALFPHDGTEAEMLVRASEAAKNQAMEDGPGSYRLYDAAMHQRLLEGLRLEQEMNEAIRACSFDPWFQPKVDKSGRIVGAEALARWNLLDGRIRLPGEFIQAAERTGHIDDIGRIVLSKTCERAASWERKGLPMIPVSVNLSPFQFKSDLLVREIRAILADTRLSPERLDIEITESGIMEDPASAVEKLAELKALGCSISIDDFGTGYSSFATLRDYPVDTVKLPQSFVEPLPDDGRASLIAGAVIELAHNLNFSVVAEGVETMAQLAWLDRACCDHYQGFLFAPPMPGSEFEAELAGVGRTMLN